MKLRNFTIALALLVPAAASAGPLEPTAALTNELQALGSSSEAPLAGSGSLVQAFSAPVNSSPYIYETTFHISLSNYVPPTNYVPGGNDGGGRENPPGFQAPIDQQQQPTPVPEPSTLLLVGSSLAVAAVRKARAARKQTATIQ